MPVALNSVPRIGQFGSLRDAMARAIEDPSALLVSYNTAHHVDGRIEKRKGYEFHGEVADQNEPWCTPVLDLVNDADSLLGLDATYYVRYTYVTAAGETDDLHSIGPETPGPAESSVRITALPRAIDVSVPFHLRELTISDTNNDEETTRIKVDQTPVEVCDPDVYIGWLVYSRSPRVQDETHLGYNCGADVPLYHRNQLRANGILAKITGYDPVSGWWTLDRRVEVGLSGHPDDDTIDIMMPDRNGLPIRYYNVYISTDRENFFYAGTGVSGLTATRIYEKDETLKRAPSTRVPRAAPIVTAVDVEETRHGECGTWPVLTNIEAGIHKIRITFIVDDDDVMRPPGLTEAQELLGEPEYCYSQRCAQETWPSCAAYVCVSDGQGILIQPADFPECSYEEWRIYTTQVSPLCQLTMDLPEDAYTDNDLDVAEDSQRPFAYYFPDRDLVGGTLPTVPDSLTNVTTISPLVAGTHAQWEQFGGGPPRACIFPEHDAWEDDFADNTPAYEDVVRYDSLSDADGGVQVFKFASTRDDYPTNRMDFSFWWDQCEADTTNVTHAVVAVRMRVRRGLDDYFRPQDAYRGIIISYWDEASSQLVELKDSGFYADRVWRTYYFCIEDPLSKLWTFDGEQFLSLIVTGINGVGFDVMETYSWLYELEGSCDDTCLELCFDHAVKMDQTSGGAPDDQGAWYSGDEDLTDMQVEAAVTSASVNNAAPWNLRNQAPGYEEYENESSLPGTNYQTFVGINAFVPPGVMYLDHTPEGYPCITYSRFGITGYVEGVDYEIDRYNGVVYPLTIPLGIPLTITYLLPIFSYTVDTDPTDPTQHGFPPSYQDIACCEFADARCENTNVPLWASSRDDVKVNHHHWWFRCEDSDCVEQATHLIVEMRVRQRDGGGTWDPLVQNKGWIRLWDEGAFISTGVPATSWQYLESQFGSADTLNEWVVRRYAVPWDPDVRHTHDPTDAFQGPAETYGLGLALRKYIIVSLKSDDYNGFDVDYVRVELVIKGADPVPTKWELLRDVVPYGTDIWTLKNPLREKVEDDWTYEWPEFDCGERVPVMGEWAHIRRNTTGQWPTTVRALPVARGEGLAGDRLMNFIGCGDSVFEDQDNGSLERVFHVEGRYHGQVMNTDWRFTNRLTRIFFYNPSDPTYNYRYDLVQTFPMGIGWPYTAEELEDGLVDIHGDYNPPSSLFEDTANTGCGATVDSPMTTDVNVDQTSVEDGTVPPDDDENVPVYCFDIEYYIVWVRLLKTKHRSYLVRSRPRKLTETVEVCLHPDYLPTVRFEVDICPEPQVTHFEIYRNFRNSARYYRVAQVPIDPAMIDPTSQTVHFKYEDTLTETDSDLTLPMILETGRPRAAAIMEYHEGRNWIVPQAERNVVDVTNVIMSGGSVDPEGYWPLNKYDPGMRDASAITCLCPYQSSILASVRNGMHAIRGLSTDQNDMSAIAGSGLAGHIGFVGPDAWCLIDNQVVGMTHEGPAIVLGDEVKIFGTEDIAMDNMLLDAATGFNTRVVHNRSRGISQVIITYTDDALEPTGERAIVFDKSVDGSGGISWKRWGSLPAYGITRARAQCGDEYTLMADCRGRLWDFGFVDTDAGVFIEAEFLTGWHASNSAPGIATQGDFNYWYVSGQECDKVFVDVHKDGVQQPYGFADIPLGMGSDLSTTDEVDEWDLLRRVWQHDGLFVWGDGGIWREADKDYDEQRTHHQGVYRAVQYRIHQRRADLPVGVDPCMRFEMYGFIPFHRVYAATPASSGI